MQIQTKIGLEVLACDPKIAQGWGRCGLLMNPSSLTAKFEPAWQVLSNALPEGSIVSLFGPQHGIEGTDQDNMIETGHSIHIPTGLPVYSLYSETREPTEEMFFDLDTLIIDLQIVGCRIYTWKSTIGACLKAAKKFGKKIVILDRPNPLGGKVLEGTVLEAEAKSFVGQFATPMRHGLTVGESARFFNLQIGADLEVVEMKAWNPNRDWTYTNRPWIMTSPNLPTLDSVFVYPGMVMLEGTNISEGRGTTMPFQLIGAPYIHSSKKFVEMVHECANPDALDGVYLRPVSFKPTYHKWTEQSCNGLQIHVLDPEKVRSYSLALAIIHAAKECSHGGFSWSEPPYEYNFEVTPIKLILGSLDAVDAFEQFDLNNPFWKRGIHEYAEQASKILIYQRELIY